MTGPDRAPLVAIEIRDDKPGHYHCADAIIAAIARERPVSVHIVHIARPRLAFPGMLSWMVNRGAPPLQILRPVYGIDVTRWPEPGLVVSAGGDTLAANISAARHFRVPNIFFGSLRKYRAEDFSLVLNCYDIETPAENHLRIPKPVPADPLQLPGTQRLANGLPAIAGLLIGGDAGTVTYAPGDWDRLIAFLQETHERLGLKWIVSTSRRTPAAVADRLAVLAKEPQSPITRFIDVRTAGPGSLGLLFANSGAIVVTADSSAMLSEAIWMKKPVLAVAPAKLHHPSKELAYRRRLEAEGVCREIPLAALDATTFAAALGQITPIPGNPQADLATLLREKLPALFA